MACQLGDDFLTANSVASQYNTLPAPARMTTSWSLSSRVSNRDDAQTPCPYVTRQNCRENFPQKIRISHRRGWKPDGMRCTRTQDSSLTSGVRQRKTDSCQRLT